MRHRFTALLVVAAGLACAACPAPTVAPWQIAFECRSDLECDDDYVCVGQRCVPRGSNPVVDSGQVALDAGRDGSVAPDTAAGVDATGLDHHGQDQPPAPDAVSTPDSAGRPDIVDSDRSARDVDGTDASTPDAAAPDTLSSDGVTPDTAAPDTAMPDTAMPDTAMPDTAPVDTGPPCVDEDGDLHGEHCAAGPDCNDNDRENWLELEGWVDADQDGFTVGGSALLCTPGSLPAGYAAAASAEDDCDDDPQACGAACAPDLNESWLGGTCADSLDNDCAQGADAADPGCARVVPSNIPVDRVCANAIDLELRAARTLNTDNGTIGGSYVGASVFSVVTQGGDAPEIAVFAYRRISIPYTLTVTGSRALALVACGDVQIDAQIDVCADNASGGPGGYNGGEYETAGAGFGASAGGGGASHSSRPWERSGGGGAGNGGGGARGGYVNSSYPAGAAGQVIADALIVPLVGGGGGGGGGSSSGGSGGGGGGAVQIVSDGAVTFGASGGVYACGAGGRGGDSSNAGAGGGGGAGGSVLIEARSVQVQGTLAANGGGGGGGAEYQRESGSAGGAGPYSTARASGGAGGGTGRAGGQGGSVAPNATGENGKDATRSGGGGGGAGRIRINTLTGQATVSGTISPDDASGLFTQGQVTTQ